MAHARGNVEGVQVCLKWRTTHQGTLSPRIQVTVCVRVRPFRHLELASGAVKRVPH